MTKKLGLDVQIIFRRSFIESRSRPVIIRLLFLQTSETYFQYKTRKSFRSLR
jgi:hypothetical protein